MTPARTRTRCVAPGCQQGVAGDGYTVCEDHASGHRPWYPQQQASCNDASCPSPHYARGLCKKHYDLYRRSENFERVREQATDSPFYADRPCPACGSKATVPFDQTPEVSARLGRKPAIGLGNCCACGFIFSALARSVPAAPPPVAGTERGGEPQELGVASAAASDSKAAS